MKILHVIHSLDMRSGGPSISLRELVRHQVKMGHDVTVVCTDAQSAAPWIDGAEFRKRLKNDEAMVGARLFVGRALGTIGPFRGLRHSGAAARHLKRVLGGEEEFPPQVAHIHGLFSHVTMTAARLAQRTRVPYILRPAGGLTPSAMRQGSSLGKKLLLRIGERGNVSSAAALHATSHREARLLRETFPNAKAVVIPHGVSLPSTDNRDYTCAIFRRRFPRTEGRRIVLFLSRLAPKKRADLLLLAIKELRATHPDVMLVLAGSDAGSERALRQVVTTEKLQQHVLFTGFLSGPIKAGALSCASVFVLPSEEENFGLAVIEAMAHGVPCVVSRGVDANAYVKSAFAGVVIDSTVAGIRAGLAEVLDGDQVGMGERAKAYIHTRLTWPRIAVKVDRLYQSVAREPQC